AKKVITSQSALETGLRRVTITSAEDAARTTKKMKRICVSIWAFRSWLSAARRPPSGARPDRRWRAASSFARRVRRVPEHRRGLRLVHQPVQIVHEAVAGVLGVLVVLPHVDRLHRAHLLAHPAEDAAELVDLVHDRVARSEEHTSELQSRE